MYRYLPIIRLLGCTKDGPFSAVDNTNSTEQHPCRKTAMEFSKSVGSCILPIISPMVRSHNLRREHRTQRHKLFYGPLTLWVRLYCSQHPAALTVRSAPHAHPETRALRDYWTIHFTPYVLVLHENLTHTLVVSVSHLPSVYLIIGCIPEVHACMAHRNLWSLYSTVLDPLPLPTAAARLISACKN